MVDNSKLSIKKVHRYLKQSSLDSRNTSLVSNPCNENHNTI